MNKDFITIPDFSTEEIHDTFRLAKELKEKTKNREEHHILKGQTLAMVFMKPSARTSHWRFLGKPGRCPREPGHPAAMKAVARRRAPFPGR